MRTSEILVSLAAVVVIIAGMKAASVLLVPFLLAAFLAIITTPALFWLQRRGVPSLLAIALVVIIIIGFGTVVGSVVGQSINEFLQDLPVYRERIQTLTTAASGGLAGLGIATDSLGLKDYLDPGAAMNLAGILLSSIGNMLTNAFLITMTVIFILLEAASFPKKIRKMSDSPEAEVLRWDQFLTDVKRYMVIKTWISLGTGLAVFLLLAALRIDFPVLWGLLAFALNYVPNIGSILAAVPALLLALIQAGPVQAAGATVGYLVINLVIGSIVEPRYLGRGLGLSTLVVFLSLLFWGWVLGPVGMLLSVPLTITAKIALDSRPETRWLAILLGSETDLQTSPEVETSVGFEKPNREPLPGDKSKEGEYGKK